MASYFEQQEQLVKEQEEITQAMLSERANLDNEMECLVSQRSRIASDRAQLIIEISHADGVKADLEVQRMDLDKQKAELAEQLAGIRLAKAGQLNSTDIESDSLQVQQCLEYTHGLPAFIFEEIICLFSDDIVPALQLI